jgi:ubiquinone/menaquinone biosynthesis C-methylase UbiE
MNNNNAHKKAVQQYFSSKTKYWSVLYKEDHDKDTFMNYVMRRRKFIVLNLIDKEIGQNKNIKVLDVGCGTGVYINELVKRGFNVHGMDISKEMVQKSLITVNESKKEQIRLAVGDAESIPFKSNNFDLIIGVGLLEYLPSEINALKEFRRLLKPQGILIFTLPNLFKLHNFLDPYFSIKTTFRFLKKKISNKRKLNEIKPQDFDSNENFAIKRYKKSHINKFLSYSDLQEKEVLGIGYGAFSLLNKKIFPLRLSIKISDLIEKISTIIFFKFIDKTASRWIICAHKQKP